MEQFDLGSIVAHLKLDLGQFKQGLAEAKNSTSGFKDALDNAKTGSFALLGGVTALAAGAVAFGISSVHAFNEAEQGLAQLDAVLKSTGGSAGVTRQSVIDLSKALEHQTGVSDEAVVGAQNMLLTFTNIKSNIFPDTTRAVLDMATAMNGGLLPTTEDLRQKSILLGKALQDPDAGLGALHRVGINVDELKKKFTDTMTIEEKQKLILQELNTEFGGSADAAGKTFAGAMAKLSQNFNDFQEVVGGAITNAIRPLIAAFNSWFDSIGGPQGLMKLLNEDFEKLKPLLPIIAGALIGGLVPAFIAIGAAIWGALAPLLPFIAAGAAIGLAVKLIVDQMGGWNKVMEDMKPVLEFLKQAWNEMGIVWNTMIYPALKQLWNTVQTELMPALKKLWEQIGPIMGPALKDFAIFLGVMIVANIMIVIGAITLLVKAITFIVDAVTAVVKETRREFDEFVAFWMGVGAGIQQGIDAIIGFFQRLPADIDRIMKQVQKAVSDAFGAIGDTIMHLPEIIGFAIGFAAGQFVKFVTVDVPNFVTGVVNSFNSLMAWFGALPGRIEAFVKDTWQKITTWFNKAHDDSVNTANSLVNGVVSWFSQLPGRVASAVSGLWNSASGALNDFYNNAVNWANNTVTAIVNWFKDLPGKVSGAIGNLGNQVISSIGAGFNLGKRATGGPVLRNTPYLIGEEGPEIFVPNTSGKVLPNSEVGKGVTINQENNIFNQVDLDMANRELGWRLQTQ